MWAKYPAEKRKGWRTHEQAVQEKKEKVSMVLDSAPFFALELTKIAYSTKTPLMKAKVKAEKHFDSEDPNWKEFEKNLRLKTFQKVVSEHPKADEKLKRYIENYGSYLLSKNTTANVTSPDTGHTYTIKELPGGRLGCNCGNWQYRRSVDGGDCKHIESIIGMAKQSFAWQVKNAFVRSLAFAGANLGADALLATREKRKADASVAASNLYAQQAREAAFAKFQRGR